MGLNIERFDEDYLYGTGTPDKNFVHEYGIRSLLYLVPEYETGYLKNMGNNAEALSLKYAYLPVDAGKVNPELAEKACTILAGLPTPCLVECASGRRAGAILSIYDARKHNLTPNEAEQKAKQLGLTFLSSPALLPWAMAAIESTSTK
uniref:Tyrosine specific protein phosphatases domain-containing protein n=1 Tax=Rhodosorus marinus TaxID=101924 RepID=A0A7S0G3K1_9RHOD|mmetsp:Transcript_18527/g.26889  ORF Transcript_18527/g.26889 Transcript_18527/m.26889 type:complete len:148 (+) Transcript_18527:151-594(+)|eukprot:CAMPEP_0184741420 /NCGR_PEP_ID=MMETSP0315-20130426/4437_1 /TAXON_ID=101924 /ORGANISM="Rhodosorus marinus, Strain UTEX LB 2760" /LENGTH=147 /DNA_ID=CAMNT_0027211681 /DNA_START=71 /DNA_END=514 /DNA_ORIENTATION=+